MSLTTENLNDQSDELTPSVESLHAEMMLILADVCIEMLDS